VSRFCKYGDESLGYLKAGGNLVTGSGTAGFYGGKSSVDLLS